MFGKIIRARGKPDVQRNVDDKQKCANPSDEAKDKDVPSDANTQRLKVDTH